MNPRNELLTFFLDDHFEQMSCRQCETTFLTNAFSLDCAHGDEVFQQKCKQTVQSICPQANDNVPFVLLEKRSLGLEYYCDAMTKLSIKSVPYTCRVGVLSEEDEVLTGDTIQLFTGEEPDYRIIYLMEQLEHLGDEDVAFFSDHIHGLDWQDEAVRLELLAWMTEKYGEKLAEDVRLLCRYFRENEEFISWDLHGDNLMRRPSTGELIITDPYIVKV